MIEEDIEKKHREYHVSSYASNLEEHWETCQLEYAHLSCSKNWRKNLQHVFQGHRNNIDTFIDKTGASIEGMCVLDYGIGDGHFCTVLDSEYKVGKYVGIDIAQRTLDAASINLADTDCKKEFKKLPANFKTYKPDLIASFACIQHFPNKAYLDDFLTNVENANPSWLMFQIRNDGKGERFFPEYPSLACLTNPRSIRSRLQAYKLVHKSSIAANGYQLVILGK